MIEPGERQPPGGSRWVEGSGARGKNRGARYAIALSEARETISCLQVAVAWGYIRSIDEGVARRMNRVIGTLVMVTR